MTSGLHNLQTLKKIKPRKRVGRGNASGRGTFSGRGSKGQRSRSGGASGLLRRSAMRQLLKKIPKLGGFKSLKKRPLTLTLGLLEKNYAIGELVTIETLIEKKILTKREHSAKIVDGGTLTKKLTIKNIPTSAGAAEKIKALGGSLTN